MKQIKRWGSILVALALLCSMIPVLEIRANADRIDEDNRFYMEMTYINPIYEDVITEDDLAEPDRTVLYADNRDNVDYYNFKECGEMIRDDLIARDKTIIVDAYCAFTNAANVQKDASQLLNDIMNWAMVHTGNPTEGDYILWQYAGWEASISGSYDNSYIYLTVTYTMTYYTTAAQEAKMDTAVANLLKELNVSNADSYTKLRAIYDYICANVTYDYEHLNDESYSLQYTAYAAMMNGTAVCQGYALLLYRLALELGVDARLIAGDGGGPHGWNIAKIDNLYYNLDSTWDAGQSTYSYFLVCPNNFTDHIRYAEYDTESFHTAYPMSAKDYIPNTENVLSGTCGENLTWTLSNDGTLMISGEGSMEDYASDLDVPWYNNCNRIQTLVIEHGVTSIGRSAFNGCTNLTTINIPSSVITINDAAFYGCVSLNGVTIPEGVTSIGRNVFVDCTGLTWVTIPGSVTSIGGYAFCGCENLTSITIPDSVMFIGDRAFSGCKNLTGIHVDEKNSCYSSDAYGVLFNKGKTELIQVPGGFIGHYSIPADVTAIAPAAFQACNGLTGVTIPDSVTSVGSYAFSECSSLTSVNIPESITFLAMHTFSFCHSLNSVIIPDSVTAIAGGAFLACNSLSSVTISANITSIDEYAFDCCTNLTEIYFMGKAPSFGKDVCYGVTATAYYSADESTWTADVMQNYGGTITWKPFYEILDGRDRVVDTNSNKDLSIRAAGEISEFVSVTVDGEIVDPSNYTVTEGSTIITFTAAYLKTLENGEHRIMIHFTDGAATTTVTLEEKTYIPGDITGDGKVNNRDAARLMQYLAGWDIEYVETALDVNGDGKVNNRDAARLMQYLAGWDVEIQ